MMLSWFSKSIRQSGFMVLLGVSGLSLAVNADPSRSVASSPSFNMHAVEPAQEFHMDVHGVSLDDQLFQTNTATRSLSNKDVIFHSLLSVTGKDLDWPGFPRTWHEQASSIFKSVNTSWALPNPILNLGVAVDYRYGWKTSLVMIASNRSDRDAVLDSHGVTEQEATDPLQLEIFGAGDGTGRALPKVLPGYPMVAFCAFEASFNYSVNEKGGLQFWGAGANAENVKIFSINHTINSRFFQLDGKMSPLQLLMEVCDGKYRKSVEQAVNADFSKAVIEAYAWLDQANECKPTPSDSEDGDVECLKWQKEKFDKVTRKLTVPRCVITRYGIHRCELRARQNVMCPMFWDKVAQKSIPTREAIGRSLGEVVKDTGSDYAYHCDKDYTCKMQTQPILWFNVPIWNGTARCVRK